MFNLLFDKWLPVQTADGQVLKMAPVELPGTDVIRIAHPRADYCALATELLIDIFQTVCVPRDAAERDGYVHDALVPTLEQFEAVRAGFNLDGEAARFLQTAGVEDAAATPISALFFEAPGANTVKLNRDFFVSRDAMSSLCPHCAPIGLYLVQSHARMGGQGYLVGPRATSALAAVIEGDSLWETICLNLLPVDWFDNQTGSVNETPDASFPWLNPGLELGKKQELALERLGRFGVLWWTPLSLRLQFTPNTQRAQCAACGEVHEEHIASLSWKATATKLAGAVRHPRTGWNPDGNDGAGRAREVPAEGFTFEHWQALTVGSSFTDSLPSWQSLDYEQADRVRLRLFGYAMKQNSPLAWLDETAPVLVAATPEAASQQRDASGELLKVAKNAASALGYALKAEGRAQNRFISLAEHSKQALWAQMEPEFIRILGRTQAHPLSADDLSGFQAHTRTMALRIFDEACLDEGDDEQTTKAILGRRASLIKYTSAKK